MIDNCKTFDIEYTAHTIKYLKLSSFTINSRSFRKEGE